MHLLTSRKASPPFGWYSLRLLTDGQAELIWVVNSLYTEINVWYRQLNPDTVTHPSTDRARRMLTSLSEIIIIIVVVVVVRTVLVHPVQ